MKQQYSISNDIVLKIVRKTFPNISDKNIQTFDDGWDYVVIVVKAEDPLAKNRSQLRELKSEYQERIKCGEATPELFVIDGLVYPSASKLK